MYIYVFQFYEQSVQRKMIVEMIILRKQFNEDYSKTRNMEKFQHKNYIRRTCSIVANFFLYFYKSYF